MWGRKTKVMPAAGALAPGFELGTALGGSLSLAQILSEGPALLAFFKVSCPVCRFTFPHLERLSSGSGLRVIGISQDDARDTEDFMRHSGVTFPVLLDPSKEGYPASNAYGITSVPAMFLIEQDGRVGPAFHGFSKRDIEAVAARAGFPSFFAGEAVPEWKAG